MVRVTQFFATRSFIQKHLSIKWTVSYIYITLYRSEGFALTGYDIPGCMEDGAWMLWENSSVVVVAAVAHLGLGGGKNSAFPPKSNHAPGGAHDLIS